VFARVVIAEAMRKSATRNRSRWRDALMFFAGFLTAILVLCLVAMTSRGYRESPTRNVETWARTVRAGVQNWQAATNSSSCPTIEQLVNERHLDPGQSTKDVWGRNFILECTKDEVYVTSLGPDGKRGTHDDIQIPRGERETTETVAQVVQKLDAGTESCGTVRSCLNRR
jgi:hypothetical protein